MKTRLKFLPLLLVIILALGACDGDKGEIGPQGDPGAAGATGSTGTTGNNGTGFDELTQYGSIEVTISGKRIDEVPFSQTMNCIYMPTNGGVGQNSVAYHDEKSDTYVFNLYRESKGKVTINGRINAPGIKNTMSLNIVKDADGVKFNSVQIYTDVVTKDFKTFELSHYESSSNIDFVMTVTDYVYTPATGKLTFNFAYTILAGAGNNYTGFDISVTGKANVIVFESINPL